MFEWVVSYKILFIVICLSILMLFLIIGNSLLGTKPKNENIIRTDKGPIGARFPKIGTIEKCFWQAGIIGKRSLLSVGPTPYWMKGYIIIGKKNADILKSQYVWTQMESSWKPTLDDSITGISSLRWSYSEEFNKFIKPGNYVGKFYADLDNGVLFFDVER